MRGRSRCWYMTLNWIWGRIPELRFGFIQLKETNKIGHTRTYNYLSVTSAWATSGVEFVLDVATGFGWIVEGLWRFVRRCHARRGFLTRSNAFRGFRGGFRLFWGGFRRFGDGKSGGRRPAVVVRTRRLTPGRQTRRAAATRRQRETGRRRADFGRQRRQRPHRQKSHLRRRRPGAAHPRRPLTPGGRLQRVPPHFTTLQQVKLQQTSTHFENWTRTDRRYSPSAITVSLPLPHASSHGNLTPRLPAPHMGEPHTNKNLPQTKNE